MPEYIEREALLDRANNLLGGSFSAALIYEAIEKAPTADVVEVVRCKDCQDCNKNSFCSIIDKYVTANGYCSSGERKGE